MQAIGVRGDKAALTHAKTNDAAWHQLGKALGCDAAEVENIDLDQFFELPDQPKLGGCIDVDVAQFVSRSR
jgi:hypothetical protein